MVFPLDLLREDLSLYDGRNLGLRDPEYIERLIPLLEFAYHHYFHVVSTGLENLPNGRPALLVGNHSGGLTSPDVAVALYLWARERGVDQPVYGLVHPAIFTIPGLNAYTMKIGGLRAHPKMALAALESGAPVLVYPGGAADAYRLYSRRNEVELAGRRGFIKLALRCGVPIIPIITQGAHDTLIVLNEGEEIAKRLGLDRYGIERLPITISFPYGLAIGATYTIPFPARIRVHIGEPIDVAAIASGGSRKSEAVEACYRYVHQEMQALLDGLVAEASQG
jgi:1-acyl-sn-glycerol-3-phosphate acyltransferase